jgi:hypothetical protein
VDSARRRVSHGTWKQYADQHPQQPPLAFVVNETNQTRDIAAEKVTNMLY